MIVLEDGSSFALDGGDGENRDQGAQGQERGRGLSDASAEDNDDKSSRTKRATSTDKSNGTSKKDDSSWIRAGGRRPSDLKSA